MTSVNDWAEKVLRTVELDGSSTGKVFLETPGDGAIWETWYPPFPTPDQFSVQVDSMLRSLENEWPTRQVPVHLVATSRAGEILSRLPMRVVGKAKTGSLDSVESARSAALDSLVLCIEKINQLSNCQLDAARRHIELMNASMHEQTRMIVAQREREEEGAPSAMTEMLTQQGPQIMSLLEVVMSNAIKKQ